MISKAKREEIVDQLEALDQIQADKVIVYIKHLLYTHDSDQHYELVKRKALAQIRKALRA